jgi:hypothetical protein
LEELVVALDSGGHKTVRNTRSLREWNCVEVGVEQEYAHCPWSGERVMGLWVCENGTGCRVV